MNTLIMLPEQPILVSEKEADKINLIEDETYFNSENNTLRIYGTGSVWAIDGKSIAGLPNQPKIDVSALSEEICEEIGWINLEKLARKEYEKHSVKDDRLSLNEQIQRSGGFHVGFKEGFKASQALNKKKFSIEDMLEAILYGSACEAGIHNPREESYNSMYLKFIQSLSQPKQFNVEIEMEHLTIRTPMLPVVVRSRPKITDGAIKILRIL